MTDSKTSKEKRPINVPLDAYELAGLICAAKEIEGVKDYDLGKVGEAGIRLVYETLSPESRTFIESMQAKRAEANPQSKAA